MPPMNERVAAMVRAAIVKNPQVDNAELRRRAVAIDRAVRRMSPRQFHATYRLPALRSVATSASKATPARDTMATASGAKSATTSPAATGGPKAAAAPTASQAIAKSDAAPSVPRSDGASATADVPAAPPPAAALSTSSRALARPHAAEREAVRGILQLVAREALATEDRASFVRLLDSLDERASVVLGLFGRA